MREIVATTSSSQTIEGSVTALLRVLSYGKVKFIRYYTLDIGGNVRCKVVPIDYLKRQTNKHAMLNGVAFVKVCIGGFPSYADHIIDDSGLSAAGTLRLLPDLSTFRILPYAPESAIVFGTLHEDDTVQTTSDLCCRSLLQRVIERAKNEHNISFTVGVELEFVLFDIITNQPIDLSLFADTKLLNRQQTFISAMYQTLDEQDISIELLHSESTTGQMEIVLEYSNNPIDIADRVVLARETIVAIAHQNNMKAIFLPKIYHDQAGNGCHIHMSLQDAESGRNIFVAMDYKDTQDGDIHVASESNVMSPIGQQFLEGILTNLPSIMATTMPTTNSFRRVGPGCWTGSQAIWAVDDKNAPIRVVVDTASGHSHNTRFEFKLCDSTTNIYLALSTVIVSGLDGIIYKRSLRGPLLDVGESLPASITESLDLLESNTTLKNQLPSDLMKGYIAIRRAEAMHALNLTLDDELNTALRRA
jgi:glutamine synthetase